MVKIGMWVSRSLTPFLLPPLDPIALKVVWNDDISTTNEILSYVSTQNGVDTVVLNTTDPDYDTSNHIYVFVLTSDDLNSLDENVISYFGANFPGQLVKKEFVY